MGNSNISKIIMWIVNAFFWGLGIFLASIAFNSLIDELRNMSAWILIIVFTVIGGIIMHVYNTVFNNDSHYKEFYKDIFGK